jgi:hypothetical protein
MLLLVMLHCVVLLVQLRLLLCSPSSIYLGDSSGLHAAAAPAESARANQQPKIKQYDNTTSSTHLKASLTHIPSKLWT